MQLDLTHMKAPKGTTSANIEGHTYNIGKDGVIKLTQQGHIETLKRHGFVPFFPKESPEELEARIDEMSDKEELVTFIEERGGEADTDMKLSKLRRLAKEAAAVQ